MSTIKYQFETFVKAINPLIEQYGIKKDEALNDTIKKCYQRLTETNVDDETTIEKLIGDLVRTITDAKIDDNKTKCITDICQQIGVKVGHMQRELSNHKEQIEQLKDRLDLSECYNYAFDLANLFVFYHVEPLLKSLPHYKSRYGNWKLFKEELTVLKRNIKSGKRHPDELENFVRSLQNELTLRTVDINVVRLHELIQNRNALANGKMRSKEEQEEFMDLVDGYDFSPKFKYNDLVRIMWDQLKQTQLKRYTN